MGDNQFMKNELKIEGKDSEFSKEALEVTRKKAIALIESSEFFMVLASNGVDVKGTMAMNERSKLYFRLASLNVLF